MLSDPRAPTSNYNSNKIAPSKLSQIYVAIDTDLTLGFFWKDLSLWVGYGEGWGRNFEGDALLRGTQF